MASSAESKDNEDQVNFVLSPPTLKQTAKGQVADLARSPRFGGLGSRASS